MRLVMAVSRDGFVARGPDDDMSWLGPFDKAAFRLVTGVGGMLGVGRVTAKLMPSHLEGRDLVRLSRHATRSLWSLNGFNRAFPDAWLIGGQTVALAATRACMIDEVHLCRSDRMCWGGVRLHGDLLCRHRWDTTDNQLLTFQEYEKVMSTRVGDTTVEVYR